MRPRAVSRREIIRGAGALAGLAALGRVTSAWGAEQGHAASPHLTHGTSSGPVLGAVALDVAELPLTIGGRTRQAVAVNGSVPGPLLRFREGDEAVIRVTNRLDEVTSIHWHGILLPPEMDGVPGVSFAGIAPGETFTYRFPIRQSGTYWAHSHSGFQELNGLYLPLVLDPAEEGHRGHDREHVIVLSDWSRLEPARLLAKLKKESGYFNYQRRTLNELGDDVQRVGWRAALADRAAWSRMRMDPTDFADVTGAGLTYLFNGREPGGWIGTYQPGERVRLRFIDAGAMTHFDIRIEGLTMTVIEADGQAIEPVDVEELRIAPGETYDVVVEPQASAFAIFAETIDRSGSAWGTLAPSDGITAQPPPRRPRPLRSMADMGMPPATDTAAAMATAPGGGGAEHQAHGKAPASAVAASPSGDDGSMAGMDMAGPATQPGLGGASLPGGPALTHGPDEHGPGNSQVPMTIFSRAGEPGAGLEGMPWRVLTLADLRSATPRQDAREPDREVELHITGNMERFSWSFDGKKYSEASDPIPFRHGERLRLVLVNDTMMEHPIHLHGMWMELENGAGVRSPRKHTVNVKPAERLTVAITADAPGRWALHCHLLLHMEMGMFRVVEVGDGPGPGR